MAYKDIKVQLTGTESLLQHNPSIMLTEQSMKKKQTYRPEEEAEKVAYRDEKGWLIIPRRCLKSCILNASSWYKFGRRSAKQIIAGSVKIEPENILILDEKGKPMKNYVIDSRPVVIQRRDRIIRHRPRIDRWMIEFTLKYNDKMIKETDILREILTEAGERIGLLDNRPEKYGENGTFSVTKFLPEK